MGCWKDLQLPRSNDPYSPICLVNRMDSDAFSKGVLVGKTSADQQAPVSVCGSEGSFQISRGESSTLCDFSSPTANSSVEVGASSSSSSCSSKRDTVQKLLVLLVYLLHIPLPLRSFLL